jgi:hypothetical protein
VFDILHPDLMNSRQVLLPNCKLKQRKTKSKEQSSLNNTEVYNISIFYSMDDDTELKER